MHYDVLLTKYSTYSVSCVIFYRISTKYEINLFLMSQISFRHKNSDIKFEYKNNSRMYIIRKLSQQASSSRI